MIFFRKVAFLGILLFSSVTQAAGFDLSLLDLSSLNNLIPQDIANETAKAFGIVLAHRPYQGAMSIHENDASELKLEITLVKIGDGLLTALSNNGVSGTSLQNAPSVPVPKMHIRKALSPVLDFGASGVFIAGQYIAGGDLKFNFYKPEEGLGSALRLGYTVVKAPRLNVKSISILTPELVFSRRLSFAEPYIGLGTRFISGTVSVQFPDPVGTLEKSGSGNTSFAFTGVNFVVGSKGLRVAIEGTYDLSGYSSLGTSVGLAF